MNQANQVSPVRTGTSEPPQPTPTSGSTVEQGSLVAEEHLPTTRLPPIAPPPRPRSVPPAAGPGESEFGPESTDELTRVRTPSYAPPTLPRTGWSTFVASLSQRAQRIGKVMRGPRASGHRDMGRAFGAASAALGGALALVALVSGMRGAPADASAVVAASTILGHAIVSAALLGFSLGLIFLGERIYFRRASGSHDAEGVRSGSSER
ncbi:MAG: hypothetical protein M3O36_00075 [Myxococcota bacterium]|nr:hypothetical protein [Myxococcota bacterium]